MILRQFYVDGIAHASYLLGSKNACAIVDPKRDVEDYIEAAKQLGMKITHVLETHLHADFISGHMELAARTGATICAPKAGGCLFDHVPVSEDDSLNIGEMHIEVLQTPGHTPESICYVVMDRSRGDDPVGVLTGDTLFVGDVGRPDLFPGRSDELASKLYDSLYEQVLQLPDFCEVYPAHGAGSLCGRAMSEKRSSTIGYERKFNVALQPRTREAFMEALLTDMPTAPDHFARCSEVNRKGPALTADMAHPEPLSPEQANSFVDAGGIVVDTRAPAAFGGGHVPGSYNIYGRGNFATFSGWLLPNDKELLLVTETDAQVLPLTAQLRRVGLDRVGGYLAGGVAAWVAAGMPVETTTHMSVEELNGLCASGRPLTILDVRFKSEWDADHIEGAVHMPFPDTRTRYGEIDPSATVAVMCRSGVRASIAGSILQRHGLTQVAVVTGGMGAWSAAGYASKCPG